MQLRHSTPILASIALAGLCLHPSVASAQSSARDSARDTVRSVVQSGTAVSAPSVPVSSVDVTRRSADVFGEMPAPASAAAKDDSAATEPTWDMDVRSYETQERVAHYVSLFSGRAKDHIVQGLERGSRYEPMIRSAMKAGGLPEDMYYLALVESGFDPNAYSRAAAVGMWQFMWSTGRDMGLRVDWWMDERRDPVKSTSAAVRFIKGLRDQFGSLYLAAAAYNGGPGRVSRGLARYADDLENTAGDDAFFVLAEKDYLRNETREYVPQLIAAALIAKEPGRYGMTLRTRAAFAYDSVTVPGATPIAAIARAAGVSPSDVLELNPQFLRGMTPPRSVTSVRVPVGTADHFDAAFAELPKDALIATRSAETRKGDTMDKIASAHGISSSALESFNPKLRRLKSGRLAPGQMVLVPTASVASLALRVPDPSIEKYPGSTAKLKLHVVKRGETVGGIAKKYKLTKDGLMRLNGLRKPVIFAGQELVVSGTPKAAAASRRSAKGEVKSSEAAKASKAGKTSKAEKTSKAGKTAKATKAAQAAKLPKASKATKSTKSVKASGKKEAGASSKAGARKSPKKSAGRKGRKG